MLLLVLACAMTSCVSSTTLNLKQRGYSAVPKDLSNFRDEYQNLEQNLHGRRSALLWAVLTNDAALSRTDDVVAIAPVSSSLLSARLLRGGRQIKQVQIPCKHRGNHIHLRRERGMDAKDTGLHYSKVDVNLATTPARDLETLRDIETTGMVFYVFGFSANGVVNSSFSRIR